MNFSGEIKLENFKSLTFSNNILITGTPGVGKTSLSILLADELQNRYKKDFQTINLGELIHNKKLYSSWDEKFNVPIFDEDKVIEELEYIKDGGYVIDFHSACFLPEEWFKLVVLLRCNNTDLYDRLKQRNYSDLKIKENIECEIMEITADEVKESFDPNRIIELQNEKIEDMQININKIIETFDKLNNTLI